MMVATRNPSAGAADLSPPFEQVQHELLDTLQTNGRGLSGIASDGQPDGEEDDQGDEGRHPQSRCHDRAPIAHDKFAEPVT